MFPTVRYSGKDKIIETVKNSVFSKGQWGGKKESEERRKFQGNKASLHDTAMINICHIFVQIHRMYSTKNEL